jgi:hypothetical protein
VVHLATAWNRVGSDSDAELKKENRRRFSLLAASIDLSNAGSVDVV